MSAWGTVPTGPPRLRGGGGAAAGRRRAEARGGGGAAVAAARGEGRAARVRRERRGDGARTRLPRERALVQSARRKSAATAHGKSSAAVKITSGRGRAEGRGGG